MAKGKSGGAMQGRKAKPKNKNANANANAPSLKGTCLSKEG
jgi:hypothetical protein